VFVDHPVAVAVSQSVHFPRDSKTFAGEEEGAMLLSFFLGDFFVQSSSCVDRFVRQAYFLHFFEIEKAFAVEESV
jgi:hypothetical protein